MSAARRPLLLIVLLILYLASAFRHAIEDVFSRDGFDPLLPAARVLEGRIAEQRFNEALPLALELERAYPREGQVAFWLARVHHGLRDAEREAAAWERYVELSPAPEDACPSLPEAYARAGRQAESLRASERCAAFDDNDRLRGGSDADAQ